MRFSAIALIGLAALCFLGPVLASNTYFEQSLLGAQGPSFLHWFGTDELGRDLFVRILYGGRISLTIGLAGTVVAVLFGTLYGCLAGYIGGRTDFLLMRFVDGIYPLPFTMIVILLLTLFGRNIWLLFFAIGSVRWLTLARIARNEACVLKQRPFVESARALGQSDIGILFKHILPNLAGTLIIYATLTVPNIILEEAFISFLGLGVQPPLSSWGILIQDGARTLEEFPWLLLFPSLFFFSVLFFFNFLGDGLRDAIDSKC